MLLPPSHDVTDFAGFLVELVGRGIFPVERLGGGHESCAFLFNDLLASDDDGETVATWILTADALTYDEVGVFGIRPEMAEDGAATAELVAVTDYERGWYHFPDAGVAAMPMAVLRSYAARKGWAWSTQEVTDGLAATARDVAGLGEEPHTVLVLGHPASDRDRPAVAVARMERRDGAATVLGSVDRGFVGGPAFVALPGPDPADLNALSVKCLGVLLPGRATHPVADFGQIRPLLRRIISDELTPGVHRQG